MPWPWQRVLLIALLALASCRGERDLLLSDEQRRELIANATIRFADLERTIPQRNPFDIPANPYNITLFQSITCTFAEPDCSKLQRGGSPKFECAFAVNGKNVSVKFKYDQQYNPLHKLWALGQPNHEVYASPVVERLLWILGYGADLSVPVSLNCLNCPIEPWTYVRATCGLHGMTAG